MKTKICSNIKCLKKKLLSKFHKDKYSKDEFSSWCKECVKQYYLQNKEKIQKRTKECYKENKEQINKRHKKYRYINKEKIKKQQKDWRDKNKEKIAKRMKRWNKENKIKIRKWTREYQKNRKKKNINFKISSNLRTRINIAIRKSDKSLSTMFLIGCEIDYLMFHIQEQFTHGMNWNNYGQWHIDHKLPCASYNLNIPSEQQKCFNYTNLQPLWAIDNIRKSDKI